MRTFRDGVNELVEKILPVTPEEEKEEIEVGLRVHNATYGLERNLKSLGFRSEVDEERWAVEFESGEREPTVRGVADLIPPLDPEDEEKTEVDIEYRDPTGEVHSVSWTLDTMDPDMIVEEMWRRFSREFRRFGAHLFHVDGRR